MVDKKFAEYVNSNIDKFAADVARLVSQPSVSAKKEGLEECALLVERMMKEVGLKTKILNLPDAAPLVYGEIESSKSDKTILFYNHYDVQPEEPRELWKSDPFKGEIREGRIYGRGASDDKGELVSRLKMVETYVKVFGEPPCRLKFCVEGEEEIGSVHLEDYISRDQDLFKSDAVFWEYGEIDHKGRPSIALGMKGMIYLEFRVRELETDAHSSVAAVLPSAPWRLVRLLNLLKDQNERILIPGWYDHVENVSEEEEQILREQEFDADSFLKTLGGKQFLNQMNGEQAKKALALRPTANIAGINSGYTGPGSKTVLPAEAFCKMDFRLVPDQDPKDLLEKLRNYLSEKGFGDVEIKVESMERAARTSFKDPFVKAAREAAKLVFGVDPTLKLSESGTGPLHVFTHRYKVPAVVMGVSSTDSMIHAPNENLKIDNMRKGILWFAETVERYVTTS
jgi:acetylornithine deacetylase/succinyl-diaminopimelate desuccinylase-like protein